MKKQITNPKLRHPLSVGISPVWDKNCTTLMVGSITAKDGMNKGFYYASKRNQLWQLMDLSLGLENKPFSYLKQQLIDSAELYEENLLPYEVYEEDKIRIREGFRRELLKHNIAMCDVFESCYMNNDGSLDEDIILNEKEKYPYKTMRDSLQKIINETKVKTVIVNSQQVEKWFNSLNIEGDFEVVRVPSPSPRRGGVDKKVNDWKTAFSKLEKSSNL